MNAVIVFILRLLLVLLSYLFLGWMGYTIFTDLRREREGLRKGHISQITLQINGNHQKQEKQFSTSEVIIGRDPACDFPLDEDTISLRHCRLYFYHKHWWVEDLESTNGTTLNNLVINKPTIITNDDKIRLGQVTLTIKTN